MKKIQISVKISAVVMVAVFSVAGMGVGNASATGDAYFPQDTTMQVTVDSVAKNFTILAGSEADTLVVNATTFVVTISSGQTFRVKSTDSLTFSNTRDASTTCFTGYSQLNIVGETTQYSVTVTPSSTTCTLVTSTGSGGGGGSPVSTPTPTPTPSSSVSPTPSVTVSPSVSPTPTPSSGSSPTSSSTTPEQHGLKEGDVVSASDSDDPDVYIVNKTGYKRLFLNPAIFNFYGHLGFSKVKKITAATRNAFVTSGLFRNCETNDPKVYGVQVTGEDQGMLHWVNTTGAQAVSDDPAFFNKVFCINTKEFNWYQKGSDYTSVNQIPSYIRTVSSTPTATTLKITGDVDFVNLRNSSSLQATIIGKVYPGETYPYTTVKDNWYHIQKNGSDYGWVYGYYILKM